MPSHIWGDAWFEKNGKDLDKAIIYCMTTWKKYGRIGSHGKEKYGTFRDHPYFFTGYNPLHDIFYPGHVAYRWKWIFGETIGKYIVELDFKLGDIIRFLKLHKLVQLYQGLVYNYAIQQACKKYPEIIDEIVADLEGYELVKPGIFGKIDGIEIHNKYWKTL